MNSKRRDKSIVDSLFLLALFGVFLICALFIVLFGAKIYKNTVKSSDDRFITRTSYTYITEKIRQNDNSKGIKIDTTGSNSVIILTRTENGKDYETFLYCDEGYLKEYTSAAGNTFNKASGTKIIALDSMYAEQCGTNLYSFTLTGSDISTDFHVSISSNIGGGIDE